MSIDIKTYRKEYYQRNKELLKQKKELKLVELATTRSQETRQWIQQNPKQYILNRAKQSAKHAGKEFDITVDDFEIPQYCPYLGIELTLTLGDGHKNSNVSLDRIDSSKGYIKGNVEVISHLANKMKQDATVDMLVAFAKGVLTRHT